MESSEKENQETKYRNNGIRLLYHQNYIIIERPNTGFYCSFRNTDIILEEI